MKEMLNGIWGLTKPARRRALALMVLSAFAAGPAMAQTPSWPAKTVRIIVPFSAGGTTDVLGRVLADNLSRATGQSFVVENKVGAGGAIGSAEVSRSAPDGYTLLLATASTHAVAPNLTKLPYDTVKDFTPISHLGDADQVVLMAPSLGVRTVKDLIEKAKAKPGSINFASNGVGTISHLAFELFASQTGITMNHIPYKGSSSVIPDLSAGIIQLALDVPATGLSQVKAGRVAALAVTGPNRSPLFPDVAPIADTVPGFSALTWFGIYGPAGMDPKLVEKIHAAFDKALQSPEIVERYQSLGLIMAHGTPADFAAMAARDNARWGQVVKERNIKVE